MIQVYNASNTNFNTNGDMILDPISCELEWELNGVCEIELEHEMDELGRWKSLVNESVIACPTPYSEKQLFRIYNVIKDGMTIIAYARHIFFDLANTVLLDVRPTDKTCQEALDIVLSGTGFTGSSNIITRYTNYYIRKNIVEALASDDDNSFVNTWKGERYYNNFTVYVNQSIGEDCGVIAEYGHNLSEIEIEESTTDVVTRIIPVGYDGITLSYPSPWVDSQYINNYPHIKTKVIEYPDIKVKTNTDDEGYNTLELARAALIAKAQAEYTAGIDVPSINYNIEMQELANTDEYKNFQMLESVSLGDTVTCKHKTLNVDIKARCIKLIYDCVNKKNISVELGNFKKDYFKTLSDATALIDSITGGESNTVLAEKITGIINAVKTQFRAQSSIAERQDQRAILFEDLDPISPTFGAMCLGTLGFEIASARTTDGKDWDWNTFGTGQGFYADFIVAGTMLADRIYGGTLTLGGSGNGNGICYVKNSSGTNTVTLNNAGITAIAGLIGGWTIASTAIYKNSATWGDSGGMYFGNNGLAITDVFKVDSTGKLTIKGDADDTAYAAFIVRNPADTRRTIAGINYIETGAYNGNYAKMKVYDTGSVSVIAERLGSGNYAYLSAESSGYSFFKAQDDEGAYAKIEVADGASRIDFYDSGGTRHAYISTGGGIWTDRTLTATGGKNRAVITKDYNTVLQYAYETASPYFGDIGEGIISENGECIVNLDPVLLETISTEQAYQVFTQKYTEGEITKVERYLDYFIVYGTPCLKFAWEIKAKQKDFETERLEEFIIESEG